MRVTKESEVRDRYLVIANSQQREVIKRRAIDLVRAASGTGMVIFLDKSARPLSQIFRGLWPAIHPDRSRPEIRFVNVGREKTRLVDSDDPHFSSTVQTTWQVIEVETGAKSLEEIYGEDSVRNLIRLLRSKRREKRIIVDDFVGTGESRVLASLIVKTADPGNEYSFFTFFETNEDRQPFLRYDYGGFPAAPPWHSTMTLVDDADDRGSFVTCPQRVPALRLLGRQLRNEFRMLSQEAIESIENP